MAGGAIGRTVSTAAALGALTVSALGAPGVDESFRSMLDRPLFSPSRRPPPAITGPSETLPPLAPPPSRPDVALSGVIAGRNGGVVLLKRPLDPAPVRVALGGEVDGWTVAEIHPRSVVLRRDTRSVTVTLPGPAR